jgi:Fe-S cluster biosynthesis and repair protein YggX
MKTKVRWCVSLNILYSSIKCSEPMVKEMMEHHNEVSISLIKEYKRSSRKQGLKHAHYKQNGAAKHAHIDIWECIKQNAKKAWFNKQIVVINQIILNRNLIILKLQHDSMTLLEI